MYCWGNNRFNQLGLADQHSESITFVENANFDGGVLKVACGGRHTLFLLEDGTVLSCGQNPCGQLGRKSASTSLDPIHALEAQTIVDLSSGLNHSVAICSEGNIFTWGEGLHGQLGSGKLPHQSPVPRRITGFSDIKVIQVACGHYHTLALSEDSSVYSWGKNDFGQLGLGKQITNQASPQPIKSLRGVPLVQVTAGGSHSFALSTSGNVFGWGRNSVGQLGFQIDPLKGVYKPHAVSSLRNFNVGYISCGDEHSAVLSKDGTVYTFGLGTHGQLGKNVESHTSVPQKIEEYEGQVSQVACGSYHTLLYISTSNSIVSFGYGLQAKHDTSTDEDSGQSPLPITLDISSLISSNDLVNIHVKQIFAGNYVNFANSSPQPQNHKKTFLHDNLQKICQLNRSMAKNWIESKPGREKNQDAKREISKIFSSSACLTASFLKHRVSPSDTSPLVDLDAASDLFTKLCQVKWIADTISSCFKSDLIPSMESLPTLYEALSIFLLVPQCPIMYDPNICVPLVVALANVVNNLSTNALKILESMWSALPAPWLTKQIQMFKVALVMAVLNNNNATSIKDLLEVLKKLYKVNIKANCKVPINFFCVLEVSNVIIVPVDLGNWHIWRKDTSQDESSSPVIYCRFPFILTFPTKVQYLHFDAALKKQAIKINTNQVLMMNRMQGIGDIPRIPVLHFKIRREYLLEDTLHKLSIVEDCDFQKELQVEFLGESASDPRAAKIEFFLHVAEKMVHPDYGLFTCSDPMLPVWFPTHALVEKKKYYYYGILCGLAIFNQTVMYLPFPLAFYKKILGKKITVEDLTELQPSMGSCLQIILHAKDADVEHLELYFTLTWEKQTIELIPNGATERVTGLNKKDYVNKCIDYIFNTSVAETFPEFERGLHKVCDKDILSLFQPNELMAVVAGHANYDWTIFEQNTIYMGKYSKNHPTIKMFWKAFHKLTQEQKKCFLYFLTGNDKIPVFGLESTCMKISSFGVPKEDYLPEAHTCTQQLLLPEYSSLSLLRKKLLLAIENNKGFHKI
ncbi:probable E3 ubiquitin-protein ligase HERC6 isoform X2 [Hyperolius riggenbachi]|uniref:probable E3 ubiquitin-protein ligase HERC6 isoform X2 n=1 Tax=Hyperolius riggenbachi TaxID=752182 RepID=UPI0035A3B297